MIKNQIPNNLLPKHIKVDESFELELQRYVYRKSYYEFFKDAFRQLHPNGVYNDNWHIKYICDRLQQEVMRITQRKPRKKDLIINVPFRSSKSMITSVIFPCWVWVTYPHLKFIYVSYSESLALEHAQFSKNLMISNWYQNLFGSSFKFKRAEDSKEFYANDHGGYRKSTGAQGSITGSGSDFIILDDAQSPKRAASDKEKQNTKDFWSHTLYSRLNEPEIGVRINIQQRLASDDLSGFLIDSNPDQYELICIPAELTDKTRCSPEELSKYYTNNLFWPSRFSKRVLDNYLKTLGSLNYAGQLLQRPSPEEGNLVKRFWFSVIEPEDVTHDINLEPIFYYIDTSETEKQTSDYTAILTCFKRDNCLYILDCVTYKKEFYESCNFIKDYVYRMKYTKNSKIKIEPKSAGKSIISQLKKTTGLNVMELPSPKDDKLTRLRSIQPILESRRVFLVSGNYIIPFLEEICTFPNGEHDDRLDVLVYAVTDLLAEDDFDFFFA